MSVFRKDCISIAPYLEVIRLLLDDLGTHRKWGPNLLPVAADLKHTAEPELPRFTEVSNLYNIRSNRSYLQLLFGGDEYVHWLQVPVDDPPGMHLHEPAHHLPVHAPQSLLVDYLP
jgi:hypothetical protein